MLIDLLKNTIAEFITNNADLNDWESIREFYGEYTYLAFLGIAVKNIAPIHTLSKALEVAFDYGLEEKIILEVLKDTKSADIFLEKVFDIVGLEDNIDIERLYQEYLSTDFELRDMKIVFESGKNSRDVLGSYYTQKEFAEIITRKAFEDYDLYHGKSDKMIIADYSCGSAVFLISALQICKKKGIPADIYGYDVDPVAVLIARVKCASYPDNHKIRFHVFLGNPLLPDNGDLTLRFKKAISARYYHGDMGINAIRDVDIVLGNPPWEKVRFEEKKFLHHFLPTGVAGTKTERARILDHVSVKNASYYKELLRDYEESKNYFKKSYIYKRSSCGEINTYALFTELGQRALKPNGVVGLIVKSSLLKLPVYKNFFKQLVIQDGLYDLYLFTNRNKIFNIDSREEFSVIYISKGTKKALHAAFDLTDYHEMDLCNKIVLTIDDLSLINPETGMIPNIREGKDLRFLIGLSSRFAPFGKIYAECRFGRLVHLTNHSKFIRKQPERDYIPVYEGKFIEHYTGKYATFKGMRIEEKYKNKASAFPIADPQGAEYPESRFFIRNDTWKSISKNFDNTCIIAWRSLTSATNHRTMLATVLPLIPTCQSIQILQMNEERQTLHVLALFNSIVFDYLVRLKMVGLDLTQTIIRQIPVPDIDQYDELTNFKNKRASVSTHILSRLKVLYQNDSRVAGIFEKYETYEVDYDRKRIIADLDLIIGSLYGLGTETIKSIANGFETFYSKEEVAAYFE